MLDAKKMSGILFLCRDLITNGLIVLAVVGAIFVGNYYLTHRDMVVAQSLDYSNQSK